MTEGDRRGQQIEMVRRMVEDGFNRGDLTVALDVCDPQFVNRVCVYGVPMGPAGLNDHIAMIRTAYPDIELIVTDVVADDDRVCILWISRGTAMGAYMGLDATGRRFSSAQIAFYTFAGQKVIDWTGTFDSMAIFRAVTGGEESIPIADASSPVRPWAAAAVAAPAPPGARVAEVADLVAALAQPEIATLPAAIDTSSALHLAGHPPASGPEAFTERALELRAAFGSIETEVEVCVVDGDTAALRWRLRGNHVGSHLGIPATGRKVALVSSALLRFDGDHLVDWREIFDDTGFVDQTKTQYRLIAQAAP